MMIFIVMLTEKKQSSTTKEHREEDRRCCQKRRHDTISLFPSLKLPRLCVSRIEFPLCFLLSFLLLLLWLVSVAILLVFVTVKKGWENGSKPIGPAKRQPRKSHSGVWFIFFVRCSASLFVYKRKVWPESRPRLRVGEGSRGKSGEGKDAEIGLGNGQWAMGNEQWVMSKGKQHEYYSLGVCRIYVPLRFCFRPGFRHIRMDLKKKGSRQVGVTSEIVLPYTYWKILGMRYVCCAYYQGKEEQHNRL